MATTNKTPYDILGVTEVTGYLKLRAVYRTKIHEHKQNKISAINFRRICRAYETLSDFDKRERYNSHKEWISELPIDQYTSQQLAAEPALIRDLKKRFEKAKLIEINAQDPLTGHTTLYCAARAGNLEAVKFLTEHGAEPDLSQRTKSTALHVASFYGHADIVRCLLESGADYRIRNEGYATAEGEAYNEEVKRVFDELKQIAYVRVAANEFDWFRKNSLKQHQNIEYFAQRQTLLHCASKKGYLDMVRWLIEQQSASVDLPDFNENSALHLAAYGSHTTIVDYLLNRGCDPTLRNRWGTTAEEEGSRHGNRITDFFKRMRERDMFEMARNGVDWWFYYYFGDKSKDMIDSNGVSLLYYASRFGQYSVAKWLLEHGANVNIQMTTKSRSTPLHVAKFRGHFSVVELLLESGADVNIKNGFGATVFDEKVSAEVDENSSNKIKQLLLRHEQYLRSDQLIDIYVYEDDDKEEKPIAKIKLGLKAGYKDLLEALSVTSSGVYSYFSIAQRPLYFETEDTTIVSAVCCARYASSRFIDTPIHLTVHKKALDKKRYQSTRKIYELEPRQLTRIFEEQRSYHFLLEASFPEKQIFNNGILTFTFSASCVKYKVIFEVTTLRLSDVSDYNLSNAICFFKTTLDNAGKPDTLLMLPTVSIADQPNARLYMLAMPSYCWFNSDIRSNQLAMLDGIHAFIRHVDIIPGQLTLPPDMFLAAALEQPLKSRDKPVPCTCLVLRERDTHTFPYIAYHGTNINAIRSILLDGLVVPGAVVNSGIRVNPPANHFSREETYFGIADFAAAIFLSPSIHYSSDPTYARPFSHGDQQLIPVLECSVKKNSYDTNPSTVRTYIKHADDNIEAIEWRVKDPTNIEINAVLFITKIDSIAASTRERRIEIS